MTTREQAMEALQTRLQSAYSFGAVTRRLVSPETIASPGAPALVLIKHHEDYTRKGPTVPPIRTMTVMAIVSIDVANKVVHQTLDDGPLHARRHRVFRHDQGRSHRRPGRQDRQGIGADPDRDLHSVKADGL